MEEWISDHFDNWALIWFCLLFWGSIFGAVLLYLFGASLFVSFSGYALGFFLGLLAKNKGWSWIS